MANEWKVARGRGDELELALQNLDADGFEIFKVHLESGSFAVIARRPFADKKKRRFYPFETVALRASTGLLLEAHGMGQLLRASGTAQSEKSVFQMIRLEASYGADLVAFHQPGGIWISQADEHADKPLAGIGPEVGSWQMFGLLQRSGNRVSLRTFNQKKFLRVEGREGLIVPKEEPGDKADLFTLEVLRSTSAERVGVILHW